MVHRVTWTSRELDSVAAEFVKLGKDMSFASRMEQIILAQQVLPEDRRHPKTWFYPAKNKRLFEEAVQFARVKLANEPPPPPVEEEKLPPAETGPETLFTPGGVPGAWLQMVEQLGEALGRGIARGYLSQLPQAVPNDPALVASIASIARKNAREREAIASGGLSGPRRPKVMLLGGNQSQQSIVSNEVGDLVDLVCIPQDGVNRLPQALSNWNGSPIFLWTKFISHNAEERCRAAGVRDIRRFNGGLAQLSEAILNYAAEAVTK